MSRARRAVVPAALALSVLLAFALGAPSRSTVPAAHAHQRALSSSTSAPHDVRTVAAVPTPGPEWLTNQLRGASASQQLCAVLAAAVALVVAHRWRRRATHARIGIDPLRVSWSTSRAPPAFA
jgi:hypothetical protein